MVHLDVYVARVAVRCPFKLWQDLTGGHHARGCFVADQLTHHDANRVLFVVWEPNAHRSNNVFQGDMPVFLQSSRWREGGAQFYVQDNYLSGFLPSSFANCSVVGINCITGCETRKMCTVPAKSGPFIIGPTWPLVLVVLAGVSAVVTLLCTCGSCGPGLPRLSVSHIQPISLIGANLKDIRVMRCNWSGIHSIQVVVKLLSVDTDVRKPLGD